MYLLILSRGRSWCWDQARGQAHKGIDSSSAVTSDLDDHRKQRAEQSRAARNPRLYTIKHSHRHSHLPNYRIHYGTNKLFLTFQRSWRGSESPVAKLRRESFIYRLHPSIHPSSSLLHLASLLAVAVTPLSNHQYDTARYARCSIPIVYHSGLYCFCIRLRREERRPTNPRLKSDCNTCSVRLLPASPNTTINGRTY
ncbi:hypothetical protein VTL71DRAFT_15084 [Oculimacula yallundae]|uniref:Uncharacterized protein n=1 Tax=Oculimacula yallundae TaxID=86028 RepID=A0ABR4CHL5_9HELO